MHRAGPALGHAAAVFRASKPELFTNHPQKRSGRIHIEIDSFAVNGEARHSRSPLIFVLLPIALSRRRRFYIFQATRVFNTNLPTSISGRPITYVTLSRDRTSASLVYARVISNFQEY